MSTVLVTGFEPFGGGSLNPSWEAVRRLPERLGGWEIRRLRLPVAFGRAAETVLAACDPAPDAILCVGQAGGRNAVTPEAEGVNLREARIPDNDGRQPRGERIAPEGPERLYATLPVERMVSAMMETGLPAYLSHSAGTYVCNDLLYSLLLRFGGTATRVGFVHVPFLPEQAPEGVPSMPLHDIVKGLTLCLRAIILNS